MYLHPILFYVKNRMIINWKTTWFTCWELWSSQRRNPVAEITILCKWNDRNCKKRTSTGITSIRKTLRLLETVRGWIIVETTTSVSYTINACASGNTNRIRARRQNTSAIIVREIIILVIRAERRQRMIGSPRRDTTYGPRGRKRIFPAAFKRDAFTLTSIIMILPLGRLFRL